MAHIARSPRDLGNLIQRARKKRGLTQTDLAQLAGLRQELISKIERGQEGTKLSNIYALLAPLDLELMIGARMNASSPRIEDVF